VGYNQCKYLKYLVPNQSLIAGQITTGALGDGVQLVALGAQVYAKDQML